jgi:hypothetical protein
MVNVAWYPSPLLLSVLNVVCSPLAASATDVTMLATSMNPAATQAMTMLRVLGTTASTGAG